MKKDNNKNKGFTLIELLAVVVILLAISVIAITSISAAIERNRIKQNKSKEKILEGYAELYYNQHKNSPIFTDSTLPGYGKIAVGDLDASESEKQYADGSHICGYFQVSINATTKAVTFTFKKDDGYC